MELEQNWQTFSPSSLISKETEMAYVAMVFEHYHRTLITNSRARKYLDDRQIWQPKALRRWNVGFVSRSLGKAMPHCDSASGKIIRGSLQRHGIIKPNGRERFRGAFVFPVKDEMGFVVDVYARSISEYGRNGHRPYQCLREVACCLFNWECLKTCSHVLLCSSPIEALTASVWGVDNVVSLLGLDYFNEELIKQVAEFSISHVDIALSNLPHGRRTSGAISRVLKGLGISSRNLLLPNGHDLNDVHTRAGEKDKLLNELEVSGYRLLH